MELEVLRRRERELEEELRGINARLGMISMALADLTAEMRAGVITFTEYRRRLEELQRESQELRDRRSQVLYELRRVRGQRGAYEAAVEARPEPTPEPAPATETPLPEDVPPEPPVVRAPEVPDETKASEGAPPRPGPERGMMRYMRQQTELLAKQGHLAPIRVSAQVGGPIADAVQDFLTRIGLTPEALEAAVSSPADPEKAAQIAQGVATAATVAMGLLYSIGVVAEVASLGQVETVHRSINNIVSQLGIGWLVARLWSTPFDVALAIPARQYWLSRFTPMIPGAADLIRFVVREVIGPREFEKYMEMQGFSSEWSKAFWEAHWRLPSRDEVVSAYHRGLISRGELEKYMVWFDYKPEPRPGIGKSDIEILTGLLKRPIPRVDLRRAFRLGRLGHEDLVERFRWLDYEDDAELMAEIQERAAFEGLQNAVIRAAGRAYVRRLITRRELLATIEKVRTITDEAELWLARYDIERMMREAVAEEEAGEAEVEERAEEVTE